MPLNGRRRPQHAVQRHGAEQLCGVSYCLFAGGSARGGILHFCLTVSWDQDCKTNSMLQSISFVSNEPFGYIIFWFFSQRRCKGKPPLASVSRHSVVREQDVCRVLFGVLLSLRPLLSKVFRKGQ